MTAPLTKEQREALPGDQFAVPGKRKLPMPDERHTRLAWSQLSRTQSLTAYETAEAKRRIIQRAHELGMDTTDWEKISAMRIDAMALVVPDVLDHPNRMPFSGVLTRVGLPSDIAPHGSKGKRVLLTPEAAEAALDSLALMAVDYTPNFDGHDVRAKIGVITGATVEGSDLRIEGFIYAADFPEEAAEIKANKNALGFSFEAQQILVENLESDPLVITACVFTGAAILRKDKAAYTTTSLAASAATGDLDMTKEELEAVFAAALKPVTDRLDKVEASHTELGNKIEAGKELHAKVVPHADALRACAASMQTAGIGVHATRGHAAILNRMADNMEAEAMGGSLPHIYRDHDYNGGYHAAADAKPDAASAAAAVENAEVAALKAQIADMQTKLESGIAAARDASPEPQRKTISPQITALMAKASIVAPGNGEKMPVAKLDDALRASGLTIQQRIQLKTEMERAGLLDA